MKPNTIVVGCDFSELGELAVRTALELAHRTKAKRVHLVHVVHYATNVPYPTTFAPSDAAAFSDMQKKRAMSKLEAVRSDAVEITREVRVGLPARDLAAAAGDAGADVIVVASHGYGALGRAVFGSVTSALMRVSKVPILVVTKEKKDIAFETVVAGVDMSEVSPRVVEAAVHYTAPGGRTELLTAFEPPVVMNDDDLLPRLPTPEDKAKIRAERESEIRQMIPVDAEVRTIRVDAFAKAPPANAILDCAELLEADLIVVGASGHNAWHRAFIGSTAMRVMSLAPTPILLVP